MTGLFPFHHLYEWRFFSASDFPNTFACNGRFEIYREISFSQLKNIRAFQLEKGIRMKRRTVKKAGREIDADVPIPRRFSMLDFRWNLGRLQFLQALQNPMLIPKAHDDLWHA